MEYWKKLHDELLEIKHNNHPLDLKSCVYISDFISNHNIKNILEVGTGLGFSSYFFAKTTSVLEVDTIEKNYDYYCFAKSKYNSKKINYFNLDILDFKTNKKYDLIFIDGPKKHQDIIVDYVSKFLDINGFIIIDNIYLNRVKEKNTKQSIKILKSHQIFLDFLNNHKDYDVNYIGIDDGLAVLKRKKIWK